MTMIDVVVFFKKQKTNPVELAVEASSTLKETVQMAWKSMAGGKGAEENLYEKVSRNGPTAKPLIHMQYDGLFVPLPETLTVQQFISSSSSSEIYVLFDSALDNLLKGKEDEKLGASASQDPFANIKIPKTLRHPLVFNALTRPHSGSFQVAEEEHNSDFMLYRPLHGLKVICELPALDCLNVNLPPEFSEFMLNLDALVLQRRSLKLSEELQLVESVERQIEREKLSRNERQERLRVEEEEDQKRIAEILADRMRRDDIELERLEVERKELEKLQKEKIEKEFVEGLSRLGHYKAPDPVPISAPAPSFISAPLPSSSSSSVAPSQFSLSAAPFTLASSDLFSSHLSGFSEPPKPAITTPTKIDPVQPLTKPLPAQPLPSVSTPLVDPSQDLSALYSDFLKLFPSQPTTNLASVPQQSQPPPQQQQPPFSSMPVFQSQSQPQSQPQTPVSQPLFQPQVNTFPAPAPDPRSWNGNDATMFYPAQELTKRLGSNSFTPSQITEALGLFNKDLQKSEQFLRGLQTMMEMGYSEWQSKSTLLQTNLNINDALNILLSN